MGRQTSTAWGEQERTVNGSVSVCAIEGEVRADGAPKILRRGVGMHRLCARASVQEGWTGPQRMPYESANMIQCCEGGQAWAWMGSVQGLQHKAL